MIIITALRLVQCILSETRSLRRDAPKRDTDRPEN